MRRSKRTYLWCPKCGTGYEKGRCPNCGWAERMISCADCTGYVAEDKAHTMTGGRRVCTSCKDAAIALAASRRQSEMFTQQERLFQ